MTGLNGSDLRAAERASIRAFLEGNVDLLGGRVLDYGCGAQPYRTIVEQAGGDYYGFDRADLPANVSGLDVGPPFPFLSRWDAIVCTQVLQYVDDPGLLLWQFAVSLSSTGGHLLLTYPTNWPEVEPEDLHRFTRAGVERLLARTGFDVVWHEGRYRIEIPGFDLSLGGAVVARRPAVRAAS